MKYVAQLADTGAVLVRDRQLGWLVQKRAPITSSGALLEESRQLQRHAGLAYQPGRNASLPRWCYLREQNEFLELARHYEAGRTMRYIIRQGPVAAVRVERWIAALAELLAGIHGRGDYHGDLSANNVLLTPAGELILLDWGYPGRITAAYTAPEIYQGQPAGPAADVYGLGVLWLRALDGGTSASVDPGPQAHPLLQACLNPEPQRRPGLDELVELTGQRKLYSNCLGRETSLEWVEQRLTRDWQQGAHWLGLPAASGAGKSEFLRELCWRQPAWGWGQGSTLHSPTSYGVFQEISRSPALADLKLGPLDRSRWQLLLQLFPALNPESTVPAGKSGPLGRQALAQAWSELLRQALARVGRLLLVVDDAQWIDDSSLDLLMSLCQENLPGLTVIVAWRSEEWTPPPELRLDETIELPDLDLETLDHWLQRDGLELDHLDLKQLHGWSRGLPLLLRYWIDRPQHSAFQSKVVLLLEERIGQLQPEVRQVLETAALLGKSFAHSTLEQLYPDTTPHALTVAFDQQLLLPARLGIQSFVHDRIRELLLEGLDEVRQRDLHAELAEFYLRSDQPPARECAHHLAQSGQIERAAPLALTAARQEAERLAFHSARQFYELHLSQPHNLEVWLEYRHTLDGLNQTSLALEKLDRVRHQCTDTGQRLKFLEALSELSFQLCDYAGMADYGYEARKIGGARGLGMSLYSRMVKGFQHVDENDLMKVMPLVVLYCAFFGTQMPLLAATVMSGVDQKGFYPYIQGWRSTLEKCYSKEEQPALWAGMISRLCTHRYGEYDLVEHRRILEELETILEVHGVAFELAMVQMQLGYYAIACGNYSELQRLARRLRQLATQMGSDSMLQVALHLEVEARGGAVNWEALRSRLEQPPQRFLGHPHLVVAAAQVCLRRGHPEQAWAYLNQMPQYGAVYDNAMLFAFRATTARILLQKTPRSRRALRQQYMGWLEQSVERCLKTARLMRPYWSHGLREQAQLWLAQGKEAEARRHFAYAAAEAERYGATYQEARCRLDWGQCARQCGWTEDIEQWERGRRMLRQLGNWWELDEHWERYFPLDELAEACLDHLTARRKETLLELGAGQLVESMDRVLEHHGRVQQGLLHEETRLQAENELWEKFLRHGPVLYERRRADGKLLESSPQGRVSQAAWRVELPDGSLAALELPVQRWRFAQLDHLLEIEQRLLDLQLQRDWETWGLDEHGLAQEWASLHNRHLQAEPEAGPLAQGIEWKQLDRLSALVLRQVLREITNNSKKHGQGPLQSDFHQEGDWLVGHFQQERAQRSTSGTGFGSESMRFRLAQVGGELATRLEDETYHLTLRLPCTTA